MMSRIAIGCLGGWHDTNWNRKRQEKDDFRPGHSEHEEPVEWAWRTAQQAVEFARPKLDGDDVCEKQKVSVWDK